MAQEVVDVVSECSRVSRGHGRCEMGWKGANQVLGVM